MIESEKKNVDIYDESNEELKTMIAQDKFIKIKCMRCGHIADIPAWIVEEFKEKNTEEKIKIICSKCNKSMI